MKIHLGYSLKMLKMICLFACSSLHLFNLFLYFINTWYMMPVLQVLQ